MLDPAKVLAQVETVILGKDREVRLALACFLAEGHLLIDDIPGVGKTTLALALARSLGCSFMRIQGTSALLPADVLGTSIFNPATRAFEFKPGPIFHAVVLADEINRASPKTQSALLEVMAERQVSVDGTTYPLPAPFFLIATQNPHEAHGTFPLPESQLDRFLMRVALGYPDEAHEAEILARGPSPAQANKLPAVSKPEEVNASIHAPEAVRVDPAVDGYILALVRESRQSPFVELGVSPRGALALRRAAQAWAHLQQRAFLIPDDVKALAGPVLAHRLVLSGGGSAELTAIKVIEDILTRVPVPR